jgi:hypothetical protein
VSVAILGYDPGGKGANGVACLTFDTPEAMAHLGNAKLDRAVAQSAEDALSWLQARSEGVRAAGIDTMLMWTFGDRQCDAFLRRRYKIHPGTVQALGSLRGSMLGNGVLVARELSVPTLCKSNPKAAIRAGVIGTFLTTLGLSAAIDRENDDHARDAAAGAIVAWAWITGVWANDLFASEPFQHFPAGPAFYPWPDPLELQ